MDVVHAAAEAHNEGVRLARAGDYEAAAAGLHGAVEVAGKDAADPRTLKALWEVAIKAGDWKTGIAAAVLAASRNPEDSAFVHKTVLALARCPRAALLPEERFPSVPLPPALPSLSVVLGSADDASLPRPAWDSSVPSQAWPHERIRIKDARSIYDGYARGYAQSHGEIVVFSHDDIRFAVPDLAARFAKAMAESDMVGVAGTTRVAGRALLWAGHPHLFGTVTHKGGSKTDYEFSLPSLQGPRIRVAQAFDGMFIAARRALVERIGFDAQRFAGFHFYDIDFSHRVHLAGARVAIAADLALIHESRGSFDERWTEAQRVFAAKFPLAVAPPGKERHWYTVRLPGREAVTAM